MSDPTGVNYFQHLPGSAYARSGEPATQAAQPFVPASNGQPQGTPTGTEAQYTPEQIQSLIAAAEQAQARDAATQRQLEYHRNRESQFASAQAQQEWEQNRQRVMQEASTMPFDDALNHVMNFERATTAALTDQAKNMFVSFAAGVYADKLIGDYGLSPDDRILLGNDPDRMDSIARRLSDDRRRTADEIKAMKDQIEQFSGQQYVAQRAAQGAYVSGGDTGRPPAIDPSKLSEIDELRFALRG